MNKHTDALYHAFCQLEALLRFHRYDPTQCARYVAACTWVRERMYTDFRDMNVVEVASMGMPADLAAEIVEFCQYGQIRQAYALLERTPFWAKDLLADPRVNAEALADIADQMVFLDYAHLAAQLAAGRIAGDARTLALLQAHALHAQEEEDMLA